MILPPPQPFPASGSFLHAVTSAKQMGFRLLLMLRLCAKQATIQENRLLAVVDDSHVDLAQANDGDMLANWFHLCRGLAVYPNRFDRLGSKPLL